MNLEDIPEYIWPFTYLSNKKKFEQLSERWEWNHKINLLKDTSKGLNDRNYNDSQEKRSFKPIVE